MYLDINSIKYNELYAIKYKFKEIYYFICYSI